MDFRHIAIEGPIAIGKCALTERLAARLDAGVVLDDTENPFLADFYYAGRTGAAFQAQLFSLLARHRQQVALRQSDLFNNLIISDYLFDKDKIYAYLNLDDNELFIYQRLFDLLAPDVVTPDLVIYLQTPTDLLRKRARVQGRESRTGGTPDDRYLGELNEAYLGATQTILIEGVNKKDQPYGRTRTGKLAHVDAPARTGTLVDVRINHAGPFALRGHAVDALAVV